MNKLKVLVTGAHGFLGQAVVAHLQQAYEVIPMVRTQTAMYAKALVVADISKPFILPHDVSVDLVVHCAARAHQIKETAADPSKAYREANVLGLKHVIEACQPKGLKRLILISTIKVLGERTVDKPFDEASRENPLDDYARSKWQAEKLLKDHAKTFDFVILRPPLILGPEAKGNIERLLRWVKKGVPMPLKGIRNQRSMISLEAMCEIIERCLTSPKVSNQTFCVADKHWSTPEFVRQMCLRANLKPKLWYCPTWVLRLASRMLGKHDMVAKLTDSLQVDGSKINKTIGDV